MRTLLIGGALGGTRHRAFGLRRFERRRSGEQSKPTSASTSTRSASSRGPSTRRYPRRDIDQLVSLFAPHATGTFGPGKTVTGQEQIRQVWLKSKAFKPETHWLSDHPAYKLKVTVDGDRGTLHFECHFIDVETGKVAAVTAGNLDVARIDGRWLITNFVGSTSELTI